MSMFFTKNKKRNLPVDPQKPSPIEIEIIVRMTTKESYSERKIIELEVKKNLISDSDAPLKAIKDEFAHAVESVAADIDERFEASPFLTDGYHAEKAKADQGC